MDFKITSGSSNLLKTKPQEHNQKFKLVETTPWKHKEHN
jgi:hypothetical protein